MNEVSEDRVFDVFQTHYDANDHKVYNRLLVGGFSTWEGAARAAREASAQLNVSSYGKVGFAVLPCEHKNRQSQHGGR